MSFTPQGRLTLAAGVAVPQSPIAAATTLYWTPVNGGAAPVRGADGWTSGRFGELALALDANHSHAGYHAAGGNYDVFLCIDGTGTGRLGSVAWAGNTARAVAIASVDGLPVNADPVTLRLGTATNDVVTIAATQATYLGSFNAVVDGTICWTQKDIGLWNAFNRVPLRTMLGDPTTAWAYGSTAWRPTRGSRDIQIGFMIGLPGSFIDAAYACTMTASNGQSGYIGLGLDADTPVGQISFVNFPASPPIGFPASACYAGSIGIGHHTVRALEYATGPATYYGQGALANLKLSWEA